jgi:hypothetical protein
MIGHKLPNKTKSATVAEPKLFHQLNNPFVWKKSTLLLSRTWSSILSHACSHGQATCRSRITHTFSLRRCTHADTHICIDAAAGVENSVCVRDSVRARAVMVNGPKAVTCWCLPGVYHLNAFQSWFLQQRSFEQEYYYCRKRSVKGIYGLYIIVFFIELLPYRLRV